MPPRAAAASSQPGECCSHGLEPRWRAAAGEASCSYLPLRKRMSVDGKCPAPRICIWECDGEAGDITCDIVAAPLRRSCSEGVAADAGSVVSPDNDTAAAAAEAAAVEGGRGGQEARRGHLQGAPELQPDA
ncbi:hypothetical protein PR202_gb19308 [Eleusine coracana subsp. coracana]|uniref:Uncharacterized protein n=1 Tax=Eleusine coracana subsp. coracana TaxID=191504 RepID=A0AAV5F9J2_ELECO|nr:hypothetical protein PR202_gb19308 [Eleusine coracana subsp. coracana]